MNFYYPDAQTICISINETTTDEELNHIVSVFAAAQNQNPHAQSPSFEAHLPKDQELTSAFLTHAIFNT